MRACKSIGHAKARARPPQRGRSGKKIGHSEFVLYQMQEYNRALLSPVAEFARAGAYMFSAPQSWLAYLPGANRVAAAYELLYRLGKTYEKPAWGIEELELDRGGERSVKVHVAEHEVLARPFCALLHFE